jgi:threonine dehydrogenase-like Zn-dependent dehydrogenase
MRCARWGTRGIELAEVDLREPRGGWVRLRVLACGICGSDLHGWRRDAPVDPDGIPGHEIAATLEDPSDIPGLEPGAIVAVEPRTWCGVCSWCTAGLRHLCPHGLLLGTSARGGLAEWVDVPRSSVHPVAPGISALAASLAEPLAVALRAVSRARLEPASRVLVLGGGTIGLLCGLLSRDRAGSVTVSVRHPQQAAAARRLGVHAIDSQELSAWAASESPDVVFETVGGRGETLGEAVACCRPGGRIVVLGLFSGYRDFDARSFLLKELQMVASNTYGADARGSEFATAVCWLPRLAGELVTLQTHQFPLQRVGDAFACAADKNSGALKVTVLVGGAAGSQGGRDPLTAAV